MKSHTLCNTHIAVLREAVSPDVALLPEISMSLLEFSAAIKRLSSKLHR